MKLVTFIWNGQRNIGALVDDAIVAANGELPSSMMAFLEAGESAKLHCSI